VINVMTAEVLHQAMVEEPERRDGERSETARSGGFSTIERRPAPSPDGHSDPEVRAYRRRRRYTSQYKLEMLRKADACTKPGEVAALLRKEGLYSSHLVTWRRQRVAGLTPKKRGRKRTADPRVTQLEREKTSLETEKRRLERRLQRAEAIIDFQKKVAQLLGIPLKPFEGDEIE
jgi:transposase